MKYQSSQPEDPGELLADTGSGPKVAESVLSHGEHVQDEYKLNGGADLTAWLLTQTRVYGQVVVNTTVSETRKRTMVE